MSENTNCPECGVLFGMPDGFLSNRRKDRRDFYCPNGHTMSYRESPLDKMTQERDLLKQRIAQKDDEIAAERAEKIKVERKLNRLHRGVCTCCKRTFVNLQRHIATKHPEVLKPKLVAEKIA